MCAVSSLGASLDVAVEGGTDLAAMTLLAAIFADSWHWRHCLIDCIQGQLGTRLRFI
jgi:hypothetical protein